MGSILIFLSLLNIMKEKMIRLGVLRETMAHTNEKSAKIFSSLGARI